MKIRFLPAWLPAIFPLLAHAQVAPDPADASIGAPLPVYRSAFDDYRSAMETMPSPEKGWRAANAAVGNAGMEMQAMEMTIPSHQHGPAHDATDAMHGGAHSMHDGMPMPAEHHMHGGAP